MPLIGFTCFLQLHNGILDLEGAGGVPSGHLQTPMSPLGQKRLLTAVW
jgi:hypothetical protein